MDKFFDFLRWLWVGICMLFSYLFGAYDGLLCALVTFVVIDYILGVICAGYNKELSSKIGFKGILRKIVIFSVVALATIIGVNILQVGLLIRDAVIGFYLFNEGVSILENCNKLGVKIPNVVLDSLLQVKNKFRLDGDLNKKGENKDINESGDDESHIE